MRYLLAVLALVACDNPVSPYHCGREKTALYPEVIGGQIDDAYLASDVWRVDPVTTIYFNADCSVTRR